jgi:hypothetical protein
MIFFDVETTKLVGGEIAWIAAVSTTPAPDFQVLDKWSQKVLFGEIFADADALDTFGYDARVWKNEAVPLQEALDAFNVFTRADDETYERISARTAAKYSIVRTAAYNAHFDVDAVMRGYDRLGVFWNGDPSALCVRQLAEWYFYLRPEEERPRDLKLQTVAEFLEVAPSKPNYHNPLVDARATVRIARTLLRRLDFV